MATGVSIADLAKQFEEGKRHNAKGATIERDTTADAALAKQNNGRPDFHFVGFTPKVMVSGKKGVVREQAETPELTQAYRLQRQEATAAKRLAEEEASLRLIAELQAEEATQALIAQLQAEDRAQGFTY